MILFTVNTVSLVVYAADDREEDRRAAWPEFRICLPKVFLTIAVLDALEFGTLLRYSDGDVFVFKFYHSC
jgi:hypothetical protein